MSQLFYSIIDWVQLTFRMLSATYVITSHSIPDCYQRHMLSCLVISLCPIAICCCSFISLNFCSLFCIEVWTSTQLLNAAVAFMLFTGHFVSLNDVFAQSLTIFWTIWVQIPFNWVQIPSIYPTTWQYHMLKKCQYTH